MPYNSFQITERTNMKFEEFKPMLDEDLYHEHDIARVVEQMTIGEWSEPMTGAELKAKMRAFINEEIANGR